MHTYYIPFDFTGKSGIGLHPKIAHSGIQERIDDGKVIDRGVLSGSFHVASKTERSPKELRDILAEVLSGLPEGLSYQRFINAVYSRLGKKGLKEFEHEPHGSLEEILKYNGSSPEQT